MSQKVFPIFDEKLGRKKKRPPKNDDDCIVYLGEELSTGSKNCQSVPIKQENEEQMNDSMSEIFQLYSQEQDSVVDDESVFHNSFAQIETTNLETVEEDDDDEDIKLIYDSRDLIEQICRKYNTGETKKEQLRNDKQSPILVKQKSEPNVIPIKDNSDDSDMDILLCSAADDYEKNNPTPLKPSPKLNQTKNNLDAQDKLKNLKDYLFGDDLDSLSSDEEAKIKDNIKPSSNSSSIKTNSSTKRTIRLEHTENSKKQKLNSEEDSIFVIGRPPIEAKKCQIRRPLFQNGPKKPSEITSKKTVELLLNKKYKPNTNVNQNNGFNLTQCMSIARQENRNREKLRKEKQQEEENKKCEPVKETVGASKEIRHSKSVDSGSDVVGSILNVMNIQHRDKNEKKISSCFIFENFLFRILKWSYNWLEEQNKFISEKKQIAPPPVVQDQELGPLIDSYLSYEDYYKTMFPLLLAETWEEIFNEWKETKRHEMKTYQNSPIWLKSVDKVTKHQEIMALTFQSIFNKYLFKN